MSINELQKEIRAFCHETGMEASALHQLLDLSSELGEVAKEFLQITSYGAKPLQKTKALEMELGDVFFSLLYLANSLDVDLQTALQLALTKYKERILQKGSPSSN